MIPFPRLLDANMEEIARLEPVSLSIDLYLTPLSTATMVLPPEQPAVKAGDFVELFTASGSVGIFRVQQIADDVVGSRTLSLEHGLVTLSDSLIPGETESAITSTVIDALNALLANQSRWVLGTVAIPADKTISWEYDYSVLLDSLLTIMDKFPDYCLTFDQSELPWKLNIEEVPAETASECRLSRNIVSLSVEEDFSEICTRLYIPNRTEPLDADTIGTWGIVAKNLAGDEGLTEDELLTYGQRYLEEHKNPALTISIDAIDLSAATGEPMDALHMGYLCRVCLPEFGQTINQRITALFWPDIYGQPRQVTVTLANASENAATALASLYVDTTVQRRLLYKNGQEIDRLIVRTIANEEQIDIITPKLEIMTVEMDVHAQDILTLRAGLEENEASIVLANGRIDANANEIALHAKTMVSLQSGIDDNAASIVLANGRIDANANEIALHAKTMVSLQSGIDDNAASITLANGRIDANANEIALHAKTMVTLQAGIDDNAASITLMKDEIALKADKITLNGYVTMSKFEAEFASLMDGYAYEFSTTDLSASTITLGTGLTATNGYVSANTLIGSNLTLDGKSVSLKSKTVLTGFTPAITKYSKSVMKSDGTSETITYVGNIDFTKNTATLQYLAYE